jgi:hypothetical protein
MSPRSFCDGGGLGVNAEPAGTHPSAHKISTAVKPAIVTLVAAPRRANLVPAIVEHPVGKQCLLAETTPAWLSRISDKRKADRGRQAG